MGEGEGDDDGAEDAAGCAVPQPPPVGLLQGCGKAAGCGDERGPDGDSDQDVDGAEDEDLGW